MRNGPGVAFGCFVVAAFLLMAVLSILGWDPYN